MALEVAVDFPDLPKGTPLDIGGLLVKNGEKVKVSEDAELAWVTRNQQAMKEGTDGSEQVTVTGTAKYGPSEVAKMFPAAEPRELENPYLEEKGEKVVEPTIEELGGES